MPPNIIDLTANTPSSVYTTGRGPYKVLMLTLHDTVGGTSSPDRNDLGLSTAGYQSRENGTIKWFQGDGGLSIHYLVGPEACGAKVTGSAKRKIPLTIVAATPTTRLYSAPQMARSTRAATRERQ